MRDPAPSAFLRVREPRLPGRHVLNAFAALDGHVRPRGVVGLPAPDEPSCEAAGSMEIGPA